MDDNIITISSYDSSKTNSNNLNKIISKNIEQTDEYNQENKTPSYYHYDEIISNEHTNKIKRNKKKKKKKKSQFFNKNKFSYKIHEREDPLLVTISEKIHQRKFKVYNNEKIIKSKRGKNISNNCLVYCKDGSYGLKGRNELGKEREKIVEGKENRIEEVTYKYKKKLSINKYIFKESEIKNIQNDKIREYIPSDRANKLCLVRFICLSKNYDLIKISKLFFSKNVKYNFFDNNNILCTFLTPENCIQIFYIPNDSYKTDSLDLENMDSDVHTIYIFFIFKNGSVVVWETFKNNNSNDSFINKFILLINSFSDNLLPLYLVQFDTIHYCEIETEFNHDMVHEVEHEMCSDIERENKKKTNKKCFVYNGIIYLTSDSLEQKLTVSFALSQSIRLDVHEMMMDTTISTLFNMSKEIKSKGTYIVSKKKISSMLDVYSSIINLNAVQDFLDIPEYFWNKVQYEYFWFEIYKYMEIPERVKILNKRYKYYKDFLKVIKNEIYNDKQTHYYRIIVLLLIIHILALILNGIFFTK